MFSLQRKVNVKDSGFFNYTGINTQCTNLLSNYTVFTICVQLLDVNEKDIDNLSCFFFFKWNTVKGDLLNVATLGETA